LISRLNDRKNKSENISDILVWYVPKILGQVYKIDVMVRAVLKELGNGALEDDN
jgi:hypothetical protein